MENKQMVHIASEIVVLLGLTFYFNQKHKKLMSHIEDLAQRVEEQEDMLQKHEQVIQKLVAYINQVPPTQSTQSTQSTHSTHHRTAPPVVPITPVVHTVKPKPKPKPKHAVPKQQKTSSPPHTNPPLSPPPLRLLPAARVTFDERQRAEKPPRVVEDVSSEEISEEDSDLDAELTEELGELDSDDDLKKEE